MKDINLMNGDCLVLIDDMIKQGVKVDALITDPPYNIARKTNFKSMGSRGGNVAMEFGEWDKNADILSYIEKLPFILNENSNIIIFNSWENLGLIAKKCKKNNIFIKRCLVLNKANPPPFNRDRMFVNDVEFAVWGVYNSKGKPTKWVFNREEKLERCILNTTVQNSKLHPTMKDVKIITKLIKLLTTKGQVVLDCFMGSGTTGLACKNLGRKFVGIELEKEYFDIATKRINE